MNLGIFGKEIPLYGIFFWLGIFVAAFAAIFVCKKKALPLFDLTCSAVYAVIAAIIGAKLLYLIVSWKDIMYFAKENDLEFIEILPMLIKGGFVFYGGLIGGILGLLIYSKQFKMDFSLLMDIYAAVVPLGHAIGRVGCFFGGCCYGIPYDGPFCNVYEFSTGTAPVGVPLFPVQLAEALSLLILFALQMILLFKYPQKKRALVYNYAFIYSIIRFALEFLRGDAERGSLLFFSTSQWISIAICLVTLLCFYMEYRPISKEKKNVVNAKEKDN